MKKSPLELLIRGALIGGGLLLFLDTALRKGSEAGDFAGGAALVVGLVLGLTNWDVLRSRARKRFGIRKAKK